jgi:acyl-coenzyme A synthetase/AMP-(fatty) acid ligase
LYQRWASHFGVDVLDGIGMTEMRHIFLSSRPGAVRPGTTGVAVPGYDPRILGGEGKQVAPGTPGHAVGARRLRRGRSRGECGEKSGQC